jgi:hypothetical protein
LLTASTAPVLSVAVKVKVVVPVKVPFGSKVNVAACWSYLSHRHCYLAHNVPIGVVNITWCQPVSVADNALIAVAPC